MCIRDRDIYVVAVTEYVTIVTLHYNIVEKKNFDEIVNEYLNDAKKELYKNYYERKGGAIKAFSSPFAFDWTNLITLSLIHILSHGHRLLVQAV